MCCNLKTTLHIDWQFYYLKMYQTACKYLFNLAIYQLIITPSNDITAYVLITHMPFHEFHQYSELRGLIMTGALDPEVSIINASLVPDIFALHVAAYKTLNAEKRGQLKSKTPHSELVFNLSGTKHVRFIVFRSAYQFLFQAASVLKARFFYIFYKCRYRNRCF